MLHVCYRTWPVCGPPTECVTGHFWPAWYFQMRRPGHSRILTWHRNETKSLAIADWIWYSAGEEAGLPNVAFVGAEKLSVFYITLH